ncbi:MAG: hypothetical protein ACK5OW_00515 [bacterium]|jgi:hypothetical protein
MDSKRFLMVILGTSSDIETDLNYIADGDSGVNYVDGKGIFICTFFSPYTTTEIQEKLSHRPAIMIFDITDMDNYSVNLPSKYYAGLFPEVAKTMESINESLKPKWEPVASKTKKSSKKKEVKKTEEFDSVDEILDKLSRNNYDRSCLTEKEINILNKI